MKHDELGDPIESVQLSLPKNTYDLMITPGFCISMSEPFNPPNRFHRFMQKLFFGFKYDIKVKNVSSK